MNGGSDPPPAEGPGGFGIVLPTGDAVARAGGTLQRDVLGRTWFVRDLPARAGDRPLVAVVVPDGPDATIDDHSLGALVAAALRGDLLRDGSDAGDDSDVVQFVALFPDTARFVDLREARPGDGFPLEPFEGASETRVVQSDKALGLFALVPKYRRRRSRADE